MKLSILYPTFNEDKNEFFHQNLENFKNIVSDQVEVIFADGASTDRTLQKIDEQFFRVLKGAGLARGARLHKAFEASQGEFVLLHHPRSVLDESFFETFPQNIPQNFHWGFFRHQFDKQHPLLAFTSWYSNHVRSKWKSIVYLDHCFLIRRTLLERVGGIPQLDIFEDTKLSENLRKISSAVYLPFESRTSARRFEQNGIYLQSAKNQWLKIKYIMKGYDKGLNKFYEEKDPLNSPFNKK